MCKHGIVHAYHIHTHTVPSLLDTNMLPQYAKCLAAFQDSTHKLMFGHFLRTESGHGDTIDRLTTIQHLLSDFSAHQRVIAAAQCVPLLLK